MKKILIIAAISFTGCTTLQEQDVVRRPKQDGSVETVISVKHQGAYDLLTTTHKIWVNGLIDKTIVQTDTLKSLGSITRVTDDGFGAAEKKTVPKNYEIYITVK